MFYSHLLSLPFFLFVAGDIWTHARHWSRSPEAPRVPLPFLSSSSIPLLWVHLLVNVLTQYACIRGVFMLTSRTTSLSSNLALTVRKFVSLVLSVLWFG